MCTLKSAPVLIILKTVFDVEKCLAPRQGLSRRMQFFLWFIDFTSERDSYAHFLFVCLFYEYKRMHIRDMKVKWKWRDIRPSMVTNTRNLCCAINPSKVGTHSSEQTHREHTPGAVGRHLCCGTWGGVGGLLSCSRATQSWYWRWKRALHIDSPHLQFNTSPNL